MTATGRRVITVVAGMLVFACACMAADSSENSIRAERSFTITVNATPDKAFPLFGPARESDWSPDFKPMFVFPENGDNPAEGDVFTSKPKDGRAISTWVMTVYDPSSGRVEYVEFTPGHSVTEIRFRVRKAAHSRSAVTVMYRRTALSPEAQPFIRRFADHFLQERVNWENAVNHYLETGEPLIFK